jgi:hypothetical protein
MRNYVDCSQKRQYQTETEAERVAEHQMSQNPGLQLRVYCCDTCQSYHLTSKPQRY